MAKKRARKVLVVDDDPDSVHLLKTRLASNRYEVIDGRDGFEGLLTVRQRMPDLIILDVVMPRIDGAEFLKALRKTDQFHMVPVIVLTGRTDLRQKFEALGCDYFATKPVQVDELMAKIEEVLKPHILICGEYLDFKQQVKATFPDEEFRVRFADGEAEMLEELAANRHRMCVVRLAQVKKSAEAFMAAVRERSLNPRVTVLVHSDAYVEGLEEGNPVRIAKIEVEWIRAGNAVFYDSRTKDAALSEFLRDHTSVFS